MQERPPKASSLRPVPSHSQEDQGDFDCRILGACGFVENLRAKSGEGWQRRCWVDLEDLLGRVATFCNLSKEELRQRGRRNRQAEARELFCYLATRKLRYPGAKVGGILNMGMPSVSRAVKRGEELAARRPEVMCWWEEQVKQ